MDPDKPVRFFVLLSRKEHPLWKRKLKSVISGIGIWGNESEGR